MTEQQQQLQLNQRQQQRLFAVEAYKECIDKLWTFEHKEKMLKSIARCLYNDIHHAANTVFVSEEAEYQFIGKFERGIFGRCRQLFKEDTEDFRNIQAIAEAFGAFDY